MTFIPLITTSHVSTANPNPEIAESEEFAQAAQYDGLEFDAMLERILALGIRRARLRG